MTPFDIPAWLIAVCMFAAGVSLYYSPMPRQLNSIVALSFFYLSAVYGLFFLLDTDIYWRAFFARAGLLLESFTVILSVVLYHIKKQGGWKGWKRHL